MAQKLDNVYGTSVRVKERMDSCFYDGLVSDLFEWKKIKRALGGTWTFMDHVLVFNKRHDWERLHILAWPRGSLERWRSYEAEIFPDFLLCSFIFICFFLLHFFCSFSVILLWFILTTCSSISSCFVPTLSSLITPGMVSHELMVCLVSGLLTLT